MSRCITAINGFICVVILHLMIKDGLAADCPAGKYGTGVQRCSIDCPPNCARDKCDIQSGVCSQGCKLGYHGDRCNTNTKCYNRSGDPQGTPNRPLNDIPGHSLNIFINFKLRTSGRVSYIYCYSRSNTTVFVGFWQPRGQHDGRYTFQLAEKIQLSVKEGFNMLDVRNENVTAEAQYTIGIHYGSGEEGIYYHRGDKDRDLGIPDRKLFEVINDGRRDDELLMGTSISKRPDNKLKTAAIQLFIECEEDCNAGTYGMMSNSCKPCSENCQNNLPCHSNTGTCPAGCTSGFQGDLCEQECSIGTYGENCAKECRTCRNKTCDVASGFCLNGCKSGYEGNKCDKQTATPSSGDKNTNAGAIAGTIVAIVLVLIIAAAVAFILYKKKRKVNREQAYVAEVQNLDVKPHPSAQRDFGENLPPVQNKSSKPRTQNNQKKISKDNNVKNGSVEQFAEAAHRETAEVSFHDETSSNLATQAYANDVSKPISVKELEHYVVSEKELNFDDAFQEEFMTIPSNQTEKWEFASQKALKTKNKFKNILPYDHNRVQLAKVGDNSLSTYINASFLPNYKKEKAFIAAMGPHATVMTDFWRMIWEYNIKCIVMVTRLVENMITKCERYWPKTPEETATYGDIVVAVEKEEEWMDFVTRLFVVKRDHEERRILHMMYTGWPDHGIPQHAAGILRIRRRMLQFQGASSSPVVVHCSAGVGRTGTFIAIDYLLNQGQEEQIVDVCGLINRLRGYRVNMVQTVGQYRFIYEVLCEALSYGQTTVPSAQFKVQYNADLEVSSVTNSSLMKHKYEFLGRLDPKFFPDEFEEAMSPKNKDKNRDNGVLPAEKHRIFLTDANSSVLFINAVQVNGFRENKEFVATQVPLMTTVEEFWSLVLDNKCNIIVCLEDATDGTMWYPKPQESIPYRKSVIKNINTTSDDGVTQHELLIEEQGSQQTEYANFQSSMVGHSIWLFYLPSWSKSPLKDRNPSVLIHFVMKVEEWRKANESKEPMTVVCLNGAKESGLFIAASHLMSMASSEAEVDVFQTVKEIRTTRPQFINSLEQYDFLHRLVLEFITSSYYHRQGKKPSKKPTKHKPSAQGTKSANE